MNPASQFAEYFKGFGDFNQVFATQRRNLEAFSAANQSIIESAQEMFRRQAEYTRDQIEQTLKVSREMLTGGTPEANLGRQAELARTMFEQAISNVRECSEMAAKSGFEAFDTINRRAAETFEEVSTQTARKRKSA